MSDEGTDVEIMEMQRLTPDGDELLMIVEVAAGTAIIPPSGWERKHDGNSASDIR